MSDQHPDAEPPAAPPSRYTATPAPPSRYTATPAPTVGSNAPVGPGSRYTPTPVVQRASPRDVDARPLSLPQVIGGITVVDVVVAVLGAAAAITMGILLYGIESFIRWVIGDAGCCTFNGRILAYTLLEISPFAIAGACACFSRVPWLGVVLVVLGQAPLVAYGHFHWYPEWPVLLIVLAFALGDAVQVAGGRSLPVGIVVGLIAGAGMTLRQAIDVDRFDAFNATVHDAWLFIQNLVLPGLVVFLACVLGSWLGVVSRRSSVSAP